MARMNKRKATRMNERRNESRNFNLPKYCLTNLLVRLKGNIPADHVVKEDAQGPDSRGLPVVATLLDPFRWRVDTCS